MFARGTAAQSSKPLYTSRPCPVHKRLVQDAAYARAGFVMAHRVFENLFPYSWQSTSYRLVIQWHIFGHGNDVRIARTTLADCVEIVIVGLNRENCMWRFGALSDRTLLKRYLVEAHAT